MLANFVSSEKDDLELACAEVCAQVNIDKSPLTLMFLSSHYLKEGMKLPDVLLNKNIIACTTSGEISPQLGFSSNSLTCATFNPEYFITDTFDFKDLFNLPEQKTFQDHFLETLSQHKKKMPDATSIALLLIDGLSNQEEKFLYYLEDILKDIPLVGGSSGDDQIFKCTQILIDNKFQSNGAKLILLSTNQSVHFFKKDHFYFQETKVIINSADPIKRIVYEIDGYPANIGYAKAFNVDPKELNADFFSARPLILKINEDSYVRSVQRALPDGSLIFYSAIEEGVILNTSGRKDLKDEMNNFFQDIKQNVGDNFFCIFFECILRKLEILSSKDKEELIKLYTNNNVIGFHTYGEQYCGLHVNHTLTGVAFGKKQTRPSRRN